MRRFLAVLAAPALIAQLAPAEGAPSVTAESGGFTLTIGGDDIRAEQRGRIVFSAAARNRARLAELEQGASECGARLAQLPGETSSVTVEAEEKYTPLSIVGPFLSFEYSSWSSWPCAAHPTSVNALETIDLRTPDTPARLDRLFPEAQLLAAILADRSVPRHAKGQAPSTLQGLAETQGQTDTPCEHRYSGEMLEHFAFYDAGAGFVTVRIGAPSYGCETAPEPLTHLDLRLKVPVALEADLARASTGTGGLLAKAAAARLKDTAVTLSFEKDLTALIAERRRK